MINQTAQKLAIKIRPFQINLELILLTILIVGIVLRESETGFMMTLISLAALSMLYFIMSFRLENPEKRFLTFINKLTQLSFSVGIIGILFAIQHYPGASTMLQVALATMVFGLIGLFIIKFRDNKNEKIIDSDFIRIFVIAITIGGLMVFGNLSDFYDNNYPRNIENQEIIE